MLDVVVGGEMGGSIFRLVAVVMLSLPLQPLLMLLMLLVLLMPLLVVIVVDDVEMMPLSVEVEPATLFAAAAAAAADAVVELLVSFDCESVDSVMASPTI